jgi:2-dehydropantoate 2-reductase
MRIAIMGSGAVGGYFGARLAAGGSDVTFIARGAHLAAMRERGLTVESPLGDIKLPQVKASDNPRAIGPVDFVIVAVKLWDTEQAARQIEPLVRAGASVVSFQNGVQKDEVLRRVLGEPAVMGGVCYVGASIAGPGVIRHIGKMQRLVFGEYDGRRSSRAEALLEACTRGGIDTELSADIKRAIWEKFVFLVAMSGATSSIRLTIGPIRKNPRTRAFFLDLMREVVAVGRASGIALSEDFPEQRMTFCDSLPAEMTSSMHNDLERGNRLEVDWLSGGVVELGNSVGVATPLNRAVRDILALYADGKPARSA